jgi:hypothetical protein
MNADQLREHILSSFEGVQMAEDDGNYFFFIDPTNRIPFATIVTSDKYDSYSDLARTDIYRINIGVGKQTFRSMFPVDDHHDEDTTADEIVYDYKALSTIMPHPEYHRMYWICVLNPNDDTFHKVEPMLREAYDAAVLKYRRTQEAVSRRGAAKN